MAIKQTHPACEPLLQLFWPQEKPLSEKVIIERLQEVNDILGTVPIDHQLAPMSLYKEPVWKTLSHEIFSEEYFDAMAAFIRNLRDKSDSKDFSLLEIWAWNGEFGKHLRTRVPDIPLYITDPYADVSDFVENIDYLAALEKYNPTIVIAVWPHEYMCDIDKGEDRTLVGDLRRITSVQWCILVWVPNRCRFDERWLYNYFYWDNSEFSNIVNIQELSRKQIVLPKKPCTMRVQNWVNPLLVGDQWLYKWTWNPDVSRTYFLYRQVPWW